MFADFEGADYGSWTATGDFAGTAPHRGGDGRIGEQSVDTFFGNPNDGDQNMGSIISPEFTIDRDFLDFGSPAATIPAGPRPDRGEPPGGRPGRAHGDGLRFRDAQLGAWDVKDLEGKRAHIEIVDRATGGWGHVLADHFVFSDIAAEIRSDETAVNLLVDGQVVRSTAGKESEALDWASWHVSDLKGQDAQIQIVDATAAAGATSWPTSSCSPTRPHSRPSSARAGWTTARTTTPRSPRTTCPTGAASRSAG